MLRSALAGADETSLMRMIMNADGWLAIRVFYGEFHAFRMLRLKAELTHPWRGKKKWKWGSGRLSSCVLELNIRHAAVSST